ncbi:hypothetical protein LPJ73_000306 [Coemansia sp. RSA 2703]|nr:hypothetical protein LPJ73_000306 [Coemansia sp. RSA 2703]KAJ2372621.1 hypothetical protein IW150_004028 [Coemansia sp. RSA 2607]KAJ2392528.1 hypothetical protein GGI05_002647 [Coemansia sp. RSA 2603]
MTVQLVGAEISTFTRTIRMALEYLQIAYSIQHAMPHTRLAAEYNPFGKIPTLIHDNQVINETSAIRLYIDHTFDSKLTPSDFQSLMSVTMWISIASDYVFQDLNLGLCKKRYALEAKGNNEEEIQLALQPSIDHARKVLRNLDAVFEKTSKGFVVGGSLTWADLFLFPIFADLCALPERRLVQFEAPKLFAWFEKMEKLGIAQNTFAGTVAAARL